MAKKEGGEKSQHQRHGVAKISVAAASANRHQHQRIIMRRTRNGVWQQHRVQQEKKKAAKASALKHQWR